jgi:16S rRNA processing protein RimM
MDTPRWEDLVVVARVARPHGLRGEVILNPETDFADERFSPGRRFFMLDGARMVEVVSRSVFFHRVRPVVGFEGIDSIEQADVLVGRELRIAPTDLLPLPDGMFYQHDLIGCRVETTDGADVGVVKKVDGSGNASRLVVEGASGEVLIPFAVDICPTIDPAGRRIVVDAPEGLFDLNVTRARRARRGWRR